MSCLGPIRWRGTTALLACLALAPAVGCANDPDPAPSPSPRTTTPASTLARASVGDRLTVTATVAAVLTARSFVVRDVDLTNDRLLVLAERPADVRHPDLVTVTGIVVRFRYADYQERFELSGVVDYRPYEGLKALVADRVTSLA